MPNDLVLAMQRWFHNAGNGFMVQTDSLEQELRDKGFVNIRRWCRGVDTELFQPRAAAGACSTCRGRCSPMSAGSRPRRTSTNSWASTCPAPSSSSATGRSSPSYRERYPGVVFAGWKTGEELSRYYSASDVFVFPSRFETFGLVLLEALACGLPVAAYPVPGPLDVIGKAPVGVLDHDLRHAALRALSIPRSLCREFALRFSWRRSAEEFAGNLMPIAGHRSAPPVEQRPAPLLRGKAIICFTMAVGFVDNHNPAVAHRATGGRIGTGATVLIVPGGKISMPTTAMRLVGGWVSARARLAVAGRLERRRAT